MLVIKYICFSLVFIICLGYITVKNDVIAGSNFLSKKLFYQAERTAITSIVEINLDDDSDVEIGIFDQQGLDIINLIDRSSISHIEFMWPSGIWKSRILYNDKGKKFNIIVRNDGGGNVGLMNGNGKVLWRKQSNAQLIINNMDAADLDHDNIPEFYIATNKGLQRLNLRGKFVWQKGDWVYDVEVLDPHHGGKPFIVTAMYNGHIQFRDASGEIAKELRPKVKVRNIEMIDWPSPGHILTSSDSSIMILDLNGNIVFQYKLSPFFSWKKYNIFMIGGTSVKFYRDKEPYLAVIAKLKASSGKSMLCVFSPEGDLVYKELVGVTMGIAAIKNPASANEILLVGDGPGKVFEYNPN